MGSIGVIHLLKVLDNLKTVLAVELLCALRGLQMTNNVPGYLEGDLTKLGAGTSQIFEELNKILPLPEGDTFLGTEIEAVRNYISN